MQDHADFKATSQVHSLAGLASRARDARLFPPKRSKRPLFSFRAFHQALLLAVADASSSPPTGPKPKKPKNMARITLPHSPRSDLFFSQIKRTKISKEIIDHSDEEGLTPIPESTAPRAEDLPPLPAEAITFGDPADNSVISFLALVFFFCFGSQVPIS